MGNYRRQTTKSGPVGTRNMIITAVDDDEEEKRTKTVIMIIIMKMMKTTIIVLQLSNELTNEPRIFFIPPPRPLLAYSNRHLPMALLLITHSFSIPY